MIAKDDTFEENHTDEGLNGLEMAIARNIVGGKMIVVSINGLELSTLWVII